MRGSEQLTKEIRDAAVVYQVVSLMLPEGMYISECGHMAEETDRNPAHPGQVRYCQACAEMNLRKTGEI